MKSSDSSLSVIYFILAIESIDLVFRLSSIIYDNIKKICSKEVIN